jgi:N-acetylmuramoyl-L-alanine amidase
MKNKLSFLIVALSIPLLFISNVIINPSYRSEVTRAYAKESVIQPSSTPYGITPSKSTKAPAPLIYIDPGHQLNGNNELEPIGPLSKIKKPKVSSGTKGVSTKKPEYQLNLEVSLLLRDMLQKKGFRVLMTREKNKVNLSNKERALLANEAKADLFVRIHADGNEKISINGISIQYPSEMNSYTKNIAKPSKNAATDVLKALIGQTGAHSRGIVPRSDLAGFNWSKVPTILIEMGFMTNAKEDVRLSLAEYQQKLATGMVNGVVQWFSER